MKKYLLVSLLCVVFGLQGIAQEYFVRPDDHFWRRKVVNRIDLNEKINAPLIKRESPFYTDDSNGNAYPEKDGLIMTLFNGLKAGKFIAYHPDSLENPMSYDEVKMQIKEFEGSLSGEDDFDSSFEDEFGDGDAEGSGEGFEDFEGDDSDWGFEDGDEGIDDLADASDDLGDPIGGDGGSYLGDFDPAPFENVIQFVEDRIFDKTRSDMVYDIQFIEIIWTDPGETLPEKKLCTFRYEEVLPSLDQAQWKNRFNDASYKTLREVFELRLFHSFIIDISGEGINSLQEAEYRRQKMVEFEHHLWSY